jgi:putative peptidoglycan lipid II flippase
MNSKFTSSIAGASILLMIVGLAGRGLGFIREILFANYFGLSVQFDFYLIGAVIPITINTVIYYVAQNYFIPIYIKTKTDTKTVPEQFLFSALAIFTLGSLFITVLLFTFSSPLINFYLSGNIQIGIVKSIFLIFITTIPIQAIVSILSSFLQAEYEFKYPALSQLLQNMGVIIFIVLLADSWGIHSIAWGYLAGSLLQLGYLIIRTKKLFRFIIPSIESIRNIFITTTFPLVGIIVIESISQLYSLIDRYFFLYIEPGGLSALNYAFTLFLLPISIISIAISTAIFPKFSDSFNKQDLEQSSAQIHSFFRINLFVFIPISFIYFFYGEAIVEILYQRGNFTISDTILTNDMLKIYSISLIFYSLYAVQNKILYGAGLISHLLIITLIGVILKFILNILLVSEIHQAGLALSTTLSFIFFFVVSFFLISKKIKIKLNRVFIGEMTFNAVNGLISLLTVLLIQNIIALSGGLVWRINQIVLFSIFFLINSIVAKSSSIELIRVAYAGFKSSINNR